MRASQFLRQFRFEIQYKSDKKYIVLNILLRLTSQKFYAIIIKDYFKFNALYVNYNYFFT